MKNILSFLFAIFLLLSISGCSTVTDKNDVAILPPTRVGTSSIQASLVDKYTFESAFLEADVVARIEIGNWIAEDTDIYTTYYEATTLQCFKGSLPESFTLLQDGCSAATMKEYPLFKSGNEILVFLNKATGVTYDSPYWIIGSFTTLLDVSYDEYGNRYYADRYGFLGESVEVRTNYAYEITVSNEILSIAKAKDSIISEMRYSYPYIFSEEDILTLIEKQ
ncbi:hypothetical protein P261_02707 [Lachnospiraceae bacterium TWA4]|nr:hypothetical protein P261_02707 [Lachnospiraceae bacterium TWA4]